MQIGKLRRRCAARVDRDDARTAPRLRLLGPLKQNRMAPRGVRSDEDDDVGLVEIVIASGHHVRAKGATMASDRRRHAQPRIGVDVGRTEEPLHQLVGDVIVLGQQLTGEIHGDRLRPVRLERCGKARRDGVERARPGRAHAMNGRMEQPGLGAERLAQGRALDAQSSGVGGMIAVAGDRRAALPVRRRDNAAADAAIGASRGDVERRGARVHQ